MLDKIRKISITVAAHSDESSLDDHNRLVSKRVYIDEIEATFPANDTSLADHAMQIVVAVARSLERLDRKREIK